jgi:hypothetical protein
MSRKEVRSALAWGDILAAVRAGRMRLLFDCAPIEINILLNN